MSNTDSSIPLDAFVSFGGLLKYLRRRARLTQRELSIAVGYSEAQISRLEQNLRLPELSSVAALFIPALYIEDEPETIARLMELAAQAHGEPVPASGSITFARSVRQETLETVRTIQDEALNNLPLQLTSFVGRKREMTEITNLLDKENGKSRLVTLTGSGGAGKTRLALELAEGLGEKYRDGVWFIELATISAPELLPQAIASTLRISLAREESPVRALAKCLKPKDVLLIFDNCEQIVTAMAALAEQLLQTCPHVQILATSREILNVPGEVRFRVPSLALPQKGLANREALSQFESVHLFSERARAVLPSFTLTDDSASAIARICRRVDGMPLAIELAAARMTMLSAQQIASRLEASFQLLSGGGKSIPRHETLLATIEWSYQLLPNSERELLQQLAVFVGGWTLDAAESVVDEKNTLHLLSQLVNKSLVVVDFQTQGDTRYHLSEVVREYSLHQLRKSGNQELVQRRHFDFFFQLATQAEAGFKGSEHQAWLKRLDLERDNLRAALGHGISPVNLEDALMFAGTLFWYWQTLGYISEGRTHLKEILASVHDLPSDQAVAARAKALWCASALAWIQGDYAEGNSQIKESVQLWRSIDDKHGLALSLREAGIISTYSGELGHAHSALHESIEILQEIDKNWDLALAFYNHGLVNEALLKAQMAWADFEQSRQLFQNLNEPWGLSVALCGLGRIAGRQADYTAAQSYLRESLALVQKLDDPWSIASVLYLMGEVSRLQNETAQAIEHYLDSLKLNQMVGDKAMISFALHNLGKIAQQEGKLDSAACLFGSASSLRETATVTTPWSLTDHKQCEQDIESLREQWTADFDSAWARGLAMNSDEAMAYALTLSHSASSS